MPDFSLDHKSLSGHNFIPRHNQPEIERMDSNQIAGIPPGCEIHRITIPVVSLTLNHRLITVVPPGQSTRMAGGDQIWHDTSQKAHKFPSSQIGFDHRLRRFQRMVTNRDSKPIPSGFFATTTVFNFPRAESLLWPCRKCRKGIPLNCSIGPHGRWVTGCLVGPRL